MVKRCAYGLCKSDTRYPKSLYGGVLFFPSQSQKQLERCLQWIKRCGRPHSQLNVSKINKHSYVCSKRPPQQRTEEEQRMEKEKKLEEENNNMKLKLTLKETEIENLKAQIDTL
uniref:Si:ch73-311h14.2 n=1 Tax=Kryptolebias marmoratus TaxID=37003 RepID=A0A3Q3F1U8_KRYMA